MSAATKPSPTNKIFLNSFSNLFSGAEGAKDGSQPYLNLKYSGADQASPTIHSMRSRSNVERRDRGGADLYDGDSL